MTVSPDSAIEFYERANAFYQRLIQRRFNALDTFQDISLRDHFRSEDLFFDYYADLAESLDAANFEQSRPIDARLEEFAFDGRGGVWVQVRFRGYDDRPMRPGKTELIRQDRWERAEGIWWITPAKL